jgi:putative transposase
MSTPAKRVFDRTTEGRSIKNLTVIDDATHEAVAIVAERSLGGSQLVRILEHLANTRGLPKAIRTDSGKEFCGRAMGSWAHAQGMVEAWHREYNEERPKRSLGGLTPADYAQRLMQNRLN